MAARDYGVYRIDRFQATDDPNPRPQNAPRKRTAPGHERGSWSLEPVPDLRERNINAAIEFFRTMKAPAPGVPLRARVDTPSTVPTLESFFQAES